jgi:hypothetical protein
MNKEKIEADFQYALKINGVDESYFLRLFEKQFWQDNRDVLVVAFLKFSTLDGIESFGSNCRKCGAFHSDRAVSNLCENCGLELYKSENYDDVSIQVEKMSETWKSSEH